MHAAKSRLTVISATISLTLVAAATAQTESAPTSQPVPSAVPSAVPAPVPTAVPTLQEQIKAARTRMQVLQSTLEKLKQEKAILQSVQSKGGLSPLLREQVHFRNLDGVRQVTDMGPQLPERKKARLLGDSEKAKFGDEVVFAVNGLPVRKQEFQDLFDYLRSYPRPLTDEQVKAQAIMALVQTKLVYASFPDTVAAAREKIGQIKERLKNGTPFAELAKQHSDCKETAAKGGNLGSCGRDHDDPMLARALFSLHPGQISDVIETRRGLHVLQVTGSQKGDSADKDRVTARHILVAANPDQAKIDAALQKIADGQVDLAFRDKELKEHAPEAFR